MQNFFFLIGICLLELGIFAQAYPQFGPEKKVTITGITHDAMEPFISADEQTLYFNSLNSGGNTNLYYATRVDDTTFTYQGLVGNTFDPAPSHLDAVPSLDINDRFFWVSLRDYPGIYENLLNSDLSGTSVNNIKHTYGDFNIYLPGWLIMDAAVTYDGDYLYYVNAYFNSCPFGMPCDASLGVAQKVNDTTFNKISNSDDLFFNINDANYIVYAPQLSVDGKEMYYTRILDGTVNSELCVSVRETAADTFSLPQVIYSNNGFVPEAITVTNDKSKIYYHQKNSTGVFEIFMRYRTGTLEIEERNSDLFIFPNPAVNTLYLNDHLLNDYFSFSVIDLQGEIVLSGQNEKSIDISHLQPGIYLFEIYTPAGFYSKRFLKI